MAERTQAETAYVELSRRILIQEILPNERIIEEFWAEKLHVNRSAIREGLTRLLGEGLIRQGARGGFFVSEMSEGEIEQIHELREILETAAFALACQRATAQQIDAIAETCEDFKTFVDKGYLSAAHEADLRFHQLLIAASGNTRLARFYERSHIPLFHRKAAQAQAHLEDFALTEQEHRGIVESLRARDADGGIAKLKSHLNRGKRDALK